MGIKLSVATEDVPIPMSEKMRAGFLLALGGLLAVLRRTVLPHVLVSLGLFLMSTVSWQHWTVSHLSFSIHLQHVLLWTGVLGAGVLAGLYAGLTALLYSLKCAAGYAEDFFYELFEAIKEKVRLQIDSMEEGIAKQQAKVILDNSVREVLAPLKQLSVSSVPRILVRFLAGVLTWVSRSVFLARLARVSGKTVCFSRIFASRATLIGALFLNMRWLSAFLLGCFYMLGLGWLLCSIWLVW